MVETVETRLSDLANRMVRFIDFDGSQGHRRPSTRVFLLWPRDVRAMDRQEPRQHKELKRQILVIIDEKKEK
jgi:hypothetical protein